MVPIWFSSQVLSSLQNLVETEVQFSDARCAKVLPIAISAYKDGLPPHYTQLHHQEKVRLYGYGYCALILFFIFNF